MVLEESFKIQSKDIGKGNYIKNRGILEIFENIGAHHSDIVGYGINDMEKTQISWVLIDWKVKVLNRPKYGQNLMVKTWGRSIDGKNPKAYTYRDFEIYDENKNLCVICTSKWAIINIKTGKILRIDDEMIKKYQLEEKDALGIGELKRIKEPSNFTNEIEYKVTRRDIDYNGHMHNLYYIDLAYEALPENVYEQRPFEEFRINYKREVRVGDIVKCKYTFEDGKHMVVIQNADDLKTNAIIILK